MSTAADRFTATCQDSALCAVEKASSPGRCAPANCSLASTAWTKFHHHLLSLFQEPSRQPAQLYTHCCWERQRPRIDHWLQQRGCQGPHWQEEFQRSGGSQNMNVKGLREKESGEIGDSECRLPFGGHLLQRAAGMSDSTVSSSLASTTVVAFFFSYLHSCTLQSFLQISPWLWSSYIINQIMPSSLPMTLKIQSAYHDLCNPAWLSLLPHFLPLVPSHVQRQPHCILTLPPTLQASSPLRAAHLLFLLPETLFPCLHMLWRHTSLRCHPNIAFPVFDHLMISLSLSISLLCSLLFMALISMWFYLIPYYCLSPFQNAGSVKTGICLIFFTFTPSWYSNVWHIAHTQ